jgi:hypothetical protein
LRRKENRRARRKSLEARERINNKLNSHVTPSPGIEDSRFSNYEYQMKFFGFAQKEYKFQFKLLAPFNYFLIHWLYMYIYYFNVSFSEQHFGLLNRSFWEIVIEILSYFASWDHQFELVTWEFIQKPGTAISQWELNSVDNEYVSY